MPGEIFEFTWYVADSGYQLIGAPAAKGKKSARQGRKGTGTAVQASDAPVIVAERQPDQGVPDLVPYNPLRQYKCLFRTLAETDIDEESIISFASRYGMLGLELENPLPGSTPPIVSMESLDDWRDEITAMTRALQIWDMVQDENTGGLRELLAPYMSWLKADALGGDLPDDATPGEDQAGLDTGDLRWFRTHPELMDLYAEGEVLKVAQMWIQGITNSRLERRVSPKILWDDDRLLRWGLYFVPVSLIGAIWLQFSQSVTQEKDYRRCRQCESWFEIDHYTARTNRYFCSNACRSKAYRERQSEARRLFAEGFSVAEICERTSTARSSVEKWVSDATRS